MSPTAILPKPLKTVQDVLNYRDYNGLGIMAQTFSSGEAPSEHRLL